MEKECLECGKQVKVCADGTFVVHAYPGFPVECQGSGKAAYDPPAEMNQEER